MNLRPALNTFGDKHIAAARGYLLVGVHLDLLGGVGGAPRVDTVNGVHNL